jgi:hypothetical protein
VLYVAIYLIINGGPTACCRKWTNLLEISSPLSHASTSGFEAYLKVRWGTDIFMAESHIVNIAMKFSLLSHIPLYTFILFFNEIIVF